MLALIVTGPVPNEELLLTTRPLVVPSPRLFRTHASPWRLPAWRALSSAMRLVAMQSAQLPRLLNIWNKGAGSRHAIS